MPPHLNETVVVKQSPKSARLVFEDELRLAQDAAAQAAKPGPKAEWRNEWVQIAGYTTVGRAHPSSASPVAFAYSVGRPLRVIGREGEFVKVQDLGSGQLGWVKASALAPFGGGYRLREERVAEPVVAAAEPNETVIKTEIAAPATSVAAVVTPVAAKRVTQPRSPAVAQPRKEAEAVAAAEPAPRGLFRKKRNQVQHVALDSQGIGAIMQRAFGRF